MPKVGIIRCQQTEDMCPGTTDFAFACDGKGVFIDIGPVEIVGFVSCGGCPGKRAIPRAKEMVRRGADTIVIASCISRGNPIGFPCPHFTEIRDSLKKQLPAEITLIEWTH